MKPYNDYVMDEFTQIKTFIKVVQAGSFSAAARESSSISSVARQVKSLEDSLGMRLLNRTTRSLSLTDAGQHFYTRACELVREFNSVVSETRSLQDEVRGTLKVTLRVSAGTTIVVPELPAFLKKYPELALDIQLTDERLDLVSSGIDVALWLGDLPDSELVARRLSPNNRIICATKNYITHYGTPTTPDELTKHNCLVFAGPHYKDRWIFSKNGQTEEIEVKGNIRSDNGLILLSAGISDIGIFIAHEWMMRKQINEGRVVRILDDYTVNPGMGDADLYAVYPSSRGKSKKVRAFLDFLIHVFEAHKPSTHQS